MKSLSSAFLLALAAIRLVFFAAIGSTLIGWVCGWVVGLFIGKTFLGIFAQIGITGYSLPQIGTFLGFVSGFFRTTVSKSSDK